MNSKLGQYFTTNIQLKETLNGFILNNPNLILEPSIGQGDLVDFIQKKNPEVKFDMYEIDPTITVLSSISKNDIIYGDFIRHKIDTKYETIVGNPPYIKHKKGNTYIDFTKKCVDLLKDNGELIFIVPSDFFKLTCSSILLNDMMSQGTFTHIFHPHNEKMFDNASIDILIFRYCKNELLDKKVVYNNEQLLIINSNGLITFSKEFSNEFSNEIYTKNGLLKDYFDVFVGLVNGKESVYKNDKLGNIEVLNGENKINKYIYVKKYPCEDESINGHLLNHKQTLLERKIRRFNENNWFEWGAPRNIKTIEKNIGRDCIYVYNLTRKSSISFVGKIQYFGGSLLMLIPKNETIKLDSIVKYLNSDTFKGNFMFSGRFKIGHRQLCNSLIPIP